MDLDFRDKRNLSASFVERYVEYSGDHELTKLLPFYKCYRAYVRGKVANFKLKDPNVRSKEKDTAMKEAKAYFNLASTYARSL
jgi:aminoglycoside phosphotransferase family enzyme